MKRSSPSFAELEVDGLAVDLIRDWRRYPPTTTEYGPRLHVEDLVSSKIAALGSRIENRDIIDVAELSKTWSLGWMVKQAKLRDSGISADTMLEIVRMNHHRPGQGFGRAEFTRGKAHLVEQLEQILAVERSMRLRKDWEQDRPSLDDDLGL